MFCSVILIALPSSLDLGASLTAEPERWLMRLGIDLRSLPTPQTKLTIVHVPDIEYDRWMEDLSGAKGLARLFEQTFVDEASVNQSTTVGIVLERPLTLMQSEAELLLAEMHEGELGTTPLADASKTLFARREQFVNLLRSQSVVLGLPGQFAAELPSVDQADSQLSRYPQWFQQWLWPAPPKLNADERYRPVGLQHFPIFHNKHTRDAYSVPLLWYYDASLKPTFETAFLAAAKHTPDQTAQPNAKPSYHWHAGQGLNISNSIVRLDTAASFIPLYGDHTGLRSSLRQLTLGAALQQDRIEDWILVGRDGSVHLDGVAQTIAALNDGAIVLEALWWPPTEKILLFLLMCFFVFATPRLSLAQLALSIGGTALLLIVFNLYVHMKWALWAPPGFLICYALIAGVLMSIWISRLRDHQRKLQHLDDIGHRHASSLMTQNAYDEAFEVLQACRSTPPILESMYQIGEYYESEGDLHKTLTVLHELKKRKKRYHNVHRKVKSLETFLQTTIGIGQQTSQRFLAQQTGTKINELGSSEFTQTVVLPESQQSHFGRYEVKRELGRGASGIVYLAHDPTIGRDVAIKALNYNQFAQDELSDVRDRFFREAKATGRLSHPNIVQIFDMGEQGHLAYIAMDYARGQALSDFVNEENLLPPEKVYKIVYEIAKALEYAHAQGVIHRDIKPSNILYCAESDSIKVTDLGIAHIMDHAHTRTGEILGSPLYMAPEQLLGKKVTNGSDIFSLGVVFYQLLSGKLPFLGDNLASLTYEIIHTRHASIRSLRKSLPTSAVRITNSALHKQPTARYRSAHDMTDALKRALKRDFNIDLS